MAEDRWRAREAEWRARRAREWRPREWHGRNWDDFHAREVDEGQDGRGYGGLNEWSYRDRGEGRVFDRGEDYGRGEVRGEPDRRRMWGPRLWDRRRRPGNQRGPGAASVPWPQSKKPIRRQ